MTKKPKTVTKTVFAWSDRHIAYKVVRVPSDDRFDIATAKAVAKLRKALGLPVDSPQWQVLDGRPSFFKLFR